MACFSKAAGVPPVVSTYAIESNQSKEAAAATRSQSPEDSVYRDIGALLDKLKVLGRKLKSPRPLQSLSLPELKDFLPSAEVADRMVNLYFENFESVLRILHVPTFRNEYQRYWRYTKTTPAPPSLQLKILLVVAIGSSVDVREGQHTREDVHFRDMVHKWIQAAQTWLSGPLKKDRLDVSGLQIHCLLILARQIFCVGADLVWLSAESLLNRATQMGFHRDPKYLPEMPILQSELRRRLWATAVELVVQSSLDSAMPPKLTWDDFDTEPPLNVNDEDLDSNRSSVQPQPDNVATSTSMQLLLLKSLPLRLSILHKLTSIRRKLTYEDAVSLSTEIEKVCGDQYKDFTKRLCHHSSLKTSFHRNFLDLLSRRFIVALHCQFTGQAGTNPQQYYYSRKQSLEAAFALIDHESDKAFSQVMLMGCGMFREAFRYSCTLIGVELISRAVQRAKDGTGGRNDKYMEMLMESVENMTVRAEKRIRLGETNVKKLHVLEDDGSAV